MCNSLKLQSMDENSFALNHLTWPVRWFTLIEAERMDYRYYILCRITWRLSAFLQVDIRGPPLSRISTLMSLIRHKLLTSPDSPALHLSRTLTWMTVMSVAVHCPSCYPLSYYVIDIWSKSQQSWNIGSIWIIKDTCYVWFQSQTPLMHQRGIIFAPYMASILNPPGQLLVISILQFCISGTNFKTRASRATASPCFPFYSCLTCENLQPQQYENKTYVSCCSTTSKSACCTSI